MMRSLFSGVSGLKVHQTKMDVIGNNISNVNTVGFKSSTVTFSDVLYQTTQSASGPNAETGAAGKNAMQIGLGASVAGITTNISGTGGSQRTDNPFDVMINGDGFFIVNSGGSNYFTKAGAFQIDANGTLCTPTGATVMGWQPNKEGTDIEKSAVSALHIMSADNMYANPEATTKATVSGNLDPKDSQAAKTGAPAMVSFYDNLGNEYNIKLLFKQTTTSNIYDISVADVTDSNGKSLFVKKGTDGKDEADGDFKISFGGQEFSASGLNADGTPIVTGTAPKLTFDSATGKFKQVGDTEGDKTLDIEITGAGAGRNKDAFKKITTDFSALTNYANGGTANIESKKGDADGAGAGKMTGEMTAISIDKAGKIYGSYSNGTSKLLGQIALATFANPSGLEAVGNNMFKETKNSGEFDGVGVDPTSGGNSLTTGVLEMSNVDLSQEFTQMITTQRGFQANSRIITTSDTMLEELINLKR